MRWHTAILLGIVSYLVFLVHATPAQQVIAWVGGDNPQSLALEGASGSVWSGEAERASYQRRLLGRLNWHFKPAYLLLGKLAYDLELQQAGQELKGRLLIGIGGPYRLEGIDALLLARQLPEWLQQRQLRIDGKLRAQELDLAFTRERLQSVSGSLQWLDGSVQSPLKLSLGDLQADLSTDEESGDIKASIRDLKGPMGIQADVSLKADGNYQFDGKLKPGDGVDSGLVSALKAIGRPQPDGSVKLKYSGRI